MEAQETVVCLMVVEAAVAQVLPVLPVKILVLLRVGTAQVLPCLEQV
jgi:hypothetical protein